MIDVSHPSMAELSHRLPHMNHDRKGNVQRTTDAVPEGQTEPDDAEEAAWLDSIHSAGLDSAAEVKGLHSGALVMDISELRHEQPPSSAKKALKSALR